MDDKNKIGFIFTMVGCVAGIVSAIMTGTVPKPLILAIAAGICYVSTYVVALFKVDVEEYGGSNKVLRSGVFAFIQGWLVLWFLVYEACNLYV